MCPDAFSTVFWAATKSQQAALGARSALSGLKVQFPDINITVAPDKQSAVADLTVEANVAGERDPIVQEMKFTLQKTDGEWLITRVETVRTLSILNFEPAAHSFHSFDMNVFVTGGAGYIGSICTEELLNAGHHGHGL